MIEAKGATGGGTILIGGSWQNSNSNIRQAVTTTAEAGSVIDASATENGDGGTVVLWSDIYNNNSVTNVEANLLAKGGIYSGSGGFIETSGNTLSFDNISIDNEAYDGSAGVWLLDPYNFFLDADDLSTLNTALNASNVSILTSNSSNSGIDSIFNSSHAGGYQIGSGHIVFENDFTYTGANNRTLTLTADADIYLKGISSSNAALSLDINATGDQVYLDGDISTNGGIFRYIQSRRSPSKSR